MSFKNYISIFVVVVLFLLSSGCKGNDFKPTSSNGPSVPFIHSVQPAVGSSYNETIIKIRFLRDMKQSTFNSKTIQICEAKHSSDLTNLYQFIYDSQNRTLALVPKNNDFDFGSENTVTIKISGAIQDQNGNTMASDYIWSFKTSN